MLATNFQQVSTVAANIGKPGPYNISLCDPTSAYSIRTSYAENELQNQTGVPDYNTAIYINSDPTYYLNDKVQVSLTVGDTGFFNLTKPYLYILVFDPTNHLRFMFPCGAQGQPTYFTSYGSTKWQDTPAYLNGCTNNNVPIQGLCFPRATFVTQSTGTQQMRYTFSVNESGTWSVYAFMFDTTYQTRPNIQYCTPYQFGVGQTCTPTFMQNAAGGQRGTFLVDSGTKPLPSVGTPTLVQFAVTALVGLVSFYGAGVKGYPLFEKAWDRGKEGIKNFVVIAVVFTLFSVILYVVLRL